ncbi:hypothetical protein TNCV_4979551 [Trichonephila clavipes]|nr:hypothetical protein TNCV_4979551 [Trichonephila clavipes]
MISREGGTEPKRTVTCMVLKAKGIKLYPFAAMNFAGLDPTSLGSRKSSRKVGGRRREVGGSDHPQGVLPQNYAETELNRSVTCMVLKATANDRRQLALCHDEFHGP